MKKILVCVVSLLAPITAMASGSDSDNMAVSATVSDSCTISAGALSFGTYDTVSGAAVPGEATLSVACTEGASAVLTLGQGSNPDTGSDDSAPLRQMGSSANRLAYTLYQDVGHGDLWGNTEVTGVPYTASSSAPADITVFGEISGSQDVPSGSYTDTVVATVTF